MKQEKILLTPEIAKTLLEKNYCKNRKIRKNNLFKIVNDIENGRWNPDLSEVQDPIIVSSEGYLINGQHRCSAVVVSGIPVYTTIKYEVPLDLYNLLDGISQRTAADALDCNNKRSIAALARIACLIEDGSASLITSLGGYLTSDSKTTPTRSQIIAKANEDNEKLQRFVRYSMSIGPYLCNKKGVVAAALFVIDYVNRGDALERFVSDASQMTTSSQQINAMRAFVYKNSSIKDTKTNSKWFHGVIYTAYEAYRSNTEIKQFNKINMIFSKYDKYVYDTRKSKEEN